MRCSISEVARCFGIAVSALRYYDEIGLLSPAGRRGTVREYGRRELHRLALVQLLHRDGMMSLADTAAALTGNPQDDDTATRHVVTEAIATMKDQVRRLQAAQQVLEHLLTCPRDDPLRDCPVLAEQLALVVDAVLGEDSSRIDGG